MRFVRATTGLLFVLLSAGAWASGGGDELGRIMSEDVVDGAGYGLRVWDVTPYVVADKGALKAFELAASGKFGRAARAVEECEELPEASALFLRAWYLEQVGRSRDAARLLEKVADGDSSLAALASYRLGAMKVQAGRQQEAVGHLVQALSSPALRGVAGGLLADIFSEAGQPDRALQALESALSWVEDPSDRRRLLLRYSFLLFTSGRETRGRWVLNDLYFGSVRPDSSVASRMRFFYGEAYDELAVFALLKTGSRSVLRRRLSEIERSGSSLDFEESMLRGELARLGRRNKEDALPHFEAASQVAKTREGVEAALYYTGRTLESLDKDLEARDMYDTLLNNPEFPLFRPLLVRQASICIREGVPGDGTAYLDRLLATRYAGEDLAEAYWRAGLIHYLAGRWADAEEDWRRLQESFYYHERTRWEYYGPMARYWRTRALMKSGRPDQALEEFRDQSLHRAGYYALQAHNRVTEAGFRVDSVVPARYESSPLALPATIVLPAHFATAVELFRLGLWQIAYDEARARLPSSGSMGHAVLFLASAWKRANPRSGWVIYRRLMPELPLPSESGARIWAASFRLSYLELIGKASSRSGLAGAVIAAIIRFESNFNPRVASHAGAIGLLQVKTNTGSDVSEKCLGKGRVGRRVLLDPETNLLLGSIYIAELFKRHHRDWGIALAAYNAGPGTAKWWLSRFQGLDSDEMVEQFTYPNTVGYLKRVTGAAPLYWSLYYPALGEHALDVHLPVAVPDQLNPFLDEVGGSCYSPGKGR